MTQSVELLIGNEYSRVPRASARWNRTNDYLKEHCVNIYVDVVNGSPDTIEKISFDLGGSFEPSVFVCQAPVRVVRPNGQPAYRFSTKQDVYGAFTADIRVRGIGGSSLEASHNVLLEEKANRQKPASYRFVERRPQKTLRMIKLPDMQNFGVELELTSDMYTSPQAIAENMIYPMEVIDSWSEGRPTSGYWKMIPDSSIICSTSAPDCNKFEIVSPVLCGGAGLSSIEITLRGLPKKSIKVNKSMGFHVHVDVSNLSLSELKKVCQNFIKYEDVMDTFMPNSRRSGSEESMRYFASNQEAVPGHSLKQKMAYLESCSSLTELVTAMNPKGRYYKLNLTNLDEGRQETVEFRQHSATYDYHKIAAWVRFCIWFVVHAAKFRPPKAFAVGRSNEYKFQALFDYIIKDRALKQFYTARRQHHRRKGDTEEEPCCVACAHGGICSAKSLGSRTSL